MKRTSSCRSQHEFARLAWFLYRFGCVRSAQGIVLLICSVLLGCRDDDDPAPVMDTAADSGFAVDGGTAPDATPATDAGDCAMPPNWEGRYDSAGIWNLTGPLNEDRGLGDLVSELLVEEAVRLAGVPSVAEDDARSVLQGIVGQPIKDGIDAALPPATVNMDPFMRTLLGLSGNVHVNSLVVLEEPTASQVAGREEIRTLGVDYDGSRRTIDATLLAPGGQSVVPIAAVWDGTNNAAVLTIEEHEFAISYGEVLRWMVDDIVGANALNDFAARVLATVDCSARVESVTGANNQISISVVGLSYTIDASPLVTLCEDTIADTITDMFGLFGIGTGIRLSGDVQTLDPACSGVATELASVDGYGGIISVVGPDATAPRVRVSFSATRAAR